MNNKMVGIIVDANSVKSSLDGLDLILDNITAEAITVDEVNILASTLRSIRCLAAKHASDLEQFNNSEFDSGFEPC